MDELAASGLVMLDLSFSIAELQTELRTRALCTCCDSSISHWIY